MNTRMKFTAFLVTGLLATAAQPQVLGTITASSTNVKVGEPVTITANIDVINANYCGFVVGFGDGTFKDAVSDVSTAVPLVVTRTYDKPGSYHVMLMDLKAPLAKDTTVPLTLTLQDAKGMKSTVELKLLVGMQPPAMPSHDHGTHNHSEHNHGDHKH